MELEKDRLARGAERYTLKNNAVAAFKEEEHPRGVDGKFGSGGGGTKKIEKMKTGNDFTDFIKNQIKADLSKDVVSSSKRGFVTLDTSNIDKQTLTDIARLSYQYNKYQIMDGGSKKINIIFPGSKFFSERGNKWSPGP